MRVAILIALGLGLVAGPALAFQEQTMTVSPNTRDMDGRAGESSKVERFTVRDGIRSYDGVRFNSGPIGTGGPSFGFESMRSPVNSADPYSAYYAAPGQRY